MREKDKHQDAAVSDNEDSRRWFKIVYSIVIPIVKIIFPIKCRGSENMPEGPAVVCANHSNLLDPLIAAAAFGKRHFMHFIAKIELKNVPLIGWLIEKCGVCFVKRGTGDIGAMRSMMRFLKRGEKVFIFPEGTRVGEDNMVDAKTGAVRLASKLDVPIVPVYIPRRKKLFRRMDVLIGEPYKVSGHTHDEYEQLADDIMEHIYELRDGEGA